MKRPLSSALPLITASLLPLVAPAELIDPAPFTRKAPLTVASRGEGAETLENFPVPVRISAALEGVSYSDFAAGGADLRITDATGNLLPVEVDTWNPEGESLVWVIVPELPAEGLSLTAYWGADTGGDTLPAEGPDVAAAWQAAGYAGVWHLSSDGASSPDSTGNGLDGTNGASTAYVTDGIAGAARRISDGAQGETDRSAVIMTPAYGELEVGSTFTISGWFLYKEGQTPGSDVIFSCKNQWSASGWEVLLSNGSFTDVAMVGGGNSVTAYPTFENVADGQWHHLSVVYNDKKMTTSADGVAVSSAGLWQAVASGAERLAFGNHNSKNSPPFKGVLDEIRLRRGVASEAWTAAEYQALTDPAFALLGTPEVTSMDAPALLPTVAVVPDDHAAAITFTLSRTGLLPCTATLRLGRDESGVYTEERSVELGTDTVPGKLTLSFADLECFTGYDAVLVLENSAGSAVSDPFFFRTAGEAVVDDIQTAFGPDWLEVNARFADEGTSPATVELYFRAPGAAEYTLANTWEEPAENTRLTWRFENLPMGACDLYFRTRNTCTCLDKENIATTDVTTVTLFGDIEWTGAGGDGRWSNPLNWNPQSVPGALDTAIFGEAAAGAVIELGGAVAVDTLRVNGSGALTVGCTNDIIAGATFTLRNFRREAPEGAAADATLGTVTFYDNLPVQMLANEANESVWHVAGGARVEMAGSLRDAEAAGLSFVKEGAGRMRFTCYNPPFQGPWYIREGVAEAGPAGAASRMRGRFFVGGGDNAAQLLDTGASRNNIASIDGGAVITVYTNGNYTVQGSPLNGMLGGLTIHAGGTASIGNWTYLVSITFHGGILTSGGMTGGGARVIRACASDTMAELRGACWCSSYNTTTIDVEDGAAPVDFLMTGGFPNSTDSRTVNRTGAGTAVLRGSSEHAPNSTSLTGFALTEGRTIFDNTSGSAVGKNPTVLSGGATVGGTGRLGGTSTNYLFSARGSAENPARIEPGSVDFETGASLCGTLTIGSESYPTAVSLSGGYVLDAQIGPGGEADRLFVHGTAALGETGGTLRITIDDAARAGQYVLLHATEGLTGTFENLEIISSKPQTQRVRYTDTDVLYVFAQQTMLILR